MGPQVALEGFQGGLHVSKLSHSPERSTHVQASTEKS